VGRIRLLFVHFRSFFTSIKISFFLVLSLIIVCILGTIIPQMEHPNKYLELFGESAEQLIDFLRLYDIYHAPYFLFLFFILAVNLIICSIFRFPAVLTNIKKDIWEQFKCVTKFKLNFILPGDQSENVKIACRLLVKNLGFTIQERYNHNHSFILFAQKGVWSRLSFYMVHFSILVTFVGTIIGNIFGFSGQLHVCEGTQIDSIVLNDDRLVALGFSLKLNEFMVSFYKDGIPSDYRSDVLFFTSDGKESVKSVINVNNPVRYNGVNFYQSSYGQYVKNIKFNFLYNNDKSVFVELKGNEWTKLPNGGEAIVLGAYEHTKMGSFYNGPIARIGYQGHNGQWMIFNTFQSGTNIFLHEYIKLEIINMDIIPYSMFLVKYDPGVWYIWIGCGFMILGFLFTFYVAHYKIWVILFLVSGKFTRWEIVGSTNKNYLRLHKIIKELVRQAKLSQFGE